MKKNVLVDNMTKRKSKYGDKNWWWKQLNLEKISRFYGDLMNFIQWEHLRIAFVLFRNFLNCHIYFTKKKINENATQKYRFILEKVTSVSVFGSAEKASLATQAFAPPLLQSRYRRTLPDAC